MKNGTLASSGNSYNDKYICIRDPESNLDTLNTFEINAGFGTCLRAMKDGGLVCGSSFPDRNIYIINESFQQIKSKYTDISDVYSITESYDGKIYVSSDKRLVSISKDDEINYLEKKGSVSGLIFLNSNKIILSTKEGNLEINQSGNKKLYVQTFPLRYTD
jgi:WD40 repeat protein